MKKIKIILLTIITLSIYLQAKDVATITAIRGNVDIKRDTALIVANLGTKLQEKDNILTKDNSKVQVIFKDETVISIGKNSEFSISEYLFEDNTPPIAKFNMLRGAMRTITGRIGDIAPQRFSVATKTATIGIRGTNFSVFVEDDGSSSAFCTFGAISVAIAGTTHIVQQGFYISLSPQGEVEIKEFTPAVLKEKKEKHFKEEKKEDTTNTGDTTASQDDTGSGEEVASSGNDSQLDVTTDDNSGLVVTDVSDTVGDTTQQTTDTVSLSDTIAGYVRDDLNDVQYSGTYDASNNGSNTLLDKMSGVANTANLTVNFGYDSASLTLIGNDSSTAHTFDNNPSITGTSLSIQDNSTGTVAGTFQGTTGAQVTGSWSYFAGEGVASGTFDVSNKNGMVTSGGQ